MNFLMWGNQPLPALFASSNTPAMILLCIAMTLGLLFYTFYFPDEVAGAPEKSRLAFLRERKEAVYENLRDLNFEFKAGKFPESDFQQMRTAMEEEGAALLAEIGRLESGNGESGAAISRRQGNSVPKGARR